MSGDYLRSQPSIIAYQLTLQDIAATLKLHRHNLSTFELPDIDLNSLPQTIENTRTEGLDESEVMAMVNKANVDQKVIIDDIMNLVRENDTSKANAYFIDGPGGMAKLLFLSMHNFFVHIA